MSAPDITVIVLTCNRARFVGAALASLRAQTWKHWTLLLSDTSTDARARADVTSAFEHHTRESPHSSARLLQPAPGLPQALHLAAVWPEVRTRFIALLDDDDLWMPRHLELARAWLNINPHRGVSIANSIFIDEHGRTGGLCHRADRPTPPDHDRAQCLSYLLRYPFSSTSGMVLRTSALAAHRFFVTSCVDVHLGISALLADSRVGLRPEATFYYRAHAGSAYAKGPQAHLDRHRLRLHLAARHGAALTRRVPLFPLLALKSGAWVAQAALSARLFPPAGAPKPVASAPAANLPFP